MSATLLQAFGQALRGGPGRPFLTWYDDAAGERVELSYASFDNWVTKLANFFVEEWELEPGEVLGLSLPPQWSSLVTVVGAWTANLAVDIRDHPTAERTVSTWEEIRLQVQAQPDALVLPLLVEADDAALVTANGTATHADLVERGLRASAGLGLTRGGRLATDLDPVSEIGIDAALLAPLTVGASVVVVRNATDERRTRIAEQERSSCSAWASSV